MARLLSILVSAAILLAAHSPSRAAQDASIQRAIERGKTMYLYDRAAWVTTDDLGTRLPQNRLTEIGGWVVTSSASGLHVDYFGKDSAADRVIYSADVNGKTVSNATVYPAGAGPMLQELALRMARALRAAWTEVGRRSDWRPCTNAHFNTIVLPPEPDGTIPVYFLTPQTEAESFPFGGHYEVDITVDGRTAATRAFTRSCITMTKPSPGTGPAPALMFLTHLLDPHPTEIHVFQQYYVGVPLVVGIPDPRSFWKVEGGTVEDVSDMVKR